MIHEMILTHFFFCSACPSNEKNIETVPVQLENTSAVSLKPRMNISEVLNNIETFLKEQRIQVISVVIM